SVPRNWPASRRLSTMPRITASLVVACSDGRMASRTTNSDMRMAGSLRSLLAVFRPAGAGDIAGGGGPAMVPDLLFIAAEMSPELVQGQVDRGDHVGVAVLGDEVVPVLSLNHELDVALVVTGLVQIDRHLNHRQAIENVQELQSLVADDALVVIAEVTMANGDLHLHGRDSLVPPEAVLVCRPGLGLGGDPGRCWVVSRAAPAPWRTSSSATSWQRN